MKKTMSDLRIETHTPLRNGVGKTTVLNFHEPEDFHGAGRLYGISIIEEGGSIGIHTHEGDQETYFILEGTGEYTDNGQVYQVVPGDLLICRNGDSHGLKNIGGCDLRYIALIIFTKH